MRNKFIVFIILIVIGFNGFSQVKSFRFGAKVAPNLAWISPDTEGYKKDGAVLGFSWGFLADITLTENYFVKTGFDFSYLNGKLSLPHSQILGSDTVATNGTLNRKYNLRYLDIPITIKMRTNQFKKTAFFGNVGFGTSFNLRAISQDEFVGDNGKSVSYDDNDIKDETVLIQESLIVGAGIEYFIDKSASIVVEFSYNHGLNNIFKGTSIVTGEKQRGFLNYFQLNLGIMF